MYITLDLYQQINTMTPQDMKNDHVKERTNNRQGLINYPKKVFAVGLSLYKIRIQANLFLSIAYKSRIH